MNILIDLDDSTLEKLQQKADLEGRSRKKQIEVMITKMTEEMEL